MSYSIATWNINSVRLRLSLVERFVREHTPDILCLQETKVDDPLFPKAALEALGYPYVAFSGQKSYNGVAILSKIPLSNVHSVDFGLTGQKRHIAATLPDGVTVHNFYIPAGGDIPDPVVNPKFAMKLNMVDALQEWSAALPVTEKAIILGDFNIAPLEHDVWSHKALLNVVSHTPIEVEKLTRLQQGLGWQDTVRHFVPETEKVYSWWSYRAQDWAASDRGRKLDHIWLSPAVTPRLIASSPLRDLRGWTQPSDHVPIIAHLAEG